MLAGQSGLGRARACLTACLYEKGGSGRGGETGVSLGSKDGVWAWRTVLRFIAYENTITKRKLAKCNKAAGLARLARRQYQQRA